MKIPFVRSSFWSSSAIDTFFPALSLSLRGRKLSTLKSTSRIKVRNEKFVLKFFTHMHTRFFQLLRQKSTYPNSRKKRWRKEESFHNEISKIENDSPTPSFGGEVWRCVYVLGKRKRHLKAPMVLADGGVLGEMKGRFLYCWEQSSLNKAEAVEHIWILKLICYFNPFNYNYFFCLYSKKYMQTWLS